MSSRKPPKRKPEPYRLPPNNPDAERAVLSCIIQDPACLAECRDRIRSPDAFYDLRHRKVWLALVQFENPMEIDVVTLQACFLKSGLYEQVGGIAFLTELEGFAPSAANYAYHLGIVLDMYERRQYIQLGQEITERSFNFEGSIDELRYANISDLENIKRPSNSKRVPPPIQDAADFTAFELDAPPQLIHGVLHRGCKLAMGGGSKTFKTWAFIDLALAVSNGLTWLGFGTRMARVCYINLELPDWSFQHRLAAVANARGITLEPDRLSVWNLRGHTMSYLEMLPIIAKELAGKGYGLIIPDPIYKLYGTTDENSARDISCLLNQFDQLAADTGAAIAFTSHFSKGNQSGKEAIDRISGSGVFARDPDAILTFTRHEEEDAFTVDSTLRNCSVQPPFVVKWEYPLMVRAEDLDPTKLKKPAGRKPQHSAEDILSVLPDSGLNAKEWFEAAESAEGVSQATFHRLRRALVQIKAVLKSEVNGKYIPIRTGSKTS